MELQTNHPQRGKKVICEIITYFTSQCKMSCVFITEWICLEDASKNVIHSPLSWVCITCFLVSWMRRWCVNLVWKWQKFKQNKEYSKWQNWACLQDLSQLAWHNGITKWQLVWVHGRSTTWFPKTAIDELQKMLHPASQRYLWWIFKNCIQLEFNVS